MPTSLQPINRLQTIFLCPLSRPSSLLSVRLANDHASRFWNRGRRFFHLQELRTSQRRLRFVCGPLPPRLERLATCPTSATSVIPAAHICSQRLGVVSLGKVSAFAFAHREDERRARELGLWVTRVHESVESERGHLCVCFFSCRY